MIIFGKIQIAKEEKSESEINSSWVNSNVRKGTAKNEMNLMKYIKRKA